MAFEWLTGNNPQFWKNYLSLFDNDDPHKKKRYAVYDLETTGPDAREDSLLSLGVVGISDGGIAIGDFLYASIVNDTEQNDKNDVVRADEDAVVEAEAVIRFLNFIKDATIVGHNVNNDIEMLNQALKRLELGRLKNDVMDTNVLYKKWKGITDDSEFTLDELCDALKIDRPDRNYSWGNSYTTALLFIKLKTLLKI